MNEEPGVIEYGTAATKNARHRPICTFLSLVCLVLSILVGVVFIPFVLLGLLSDDAHTLPPIAKTIVCIEVPLIGGGLVCGLIGLLKRIRFPDRYNGLPEAIVGTLFHGLAIGRILWTIWM